MRSQYLKTPMLALSILLLVACGGGGGGSDETPSDNQPDENAQPNDAEGSVAGSSCAEVISSQSNTEIALKNFSSYCDYFVDGEVEWEDVEVTVEPGTVIVFGEKSELEVDGGTFEAIGTQSDPILIRGELNNPGYWYDIRFSDMDDVNLEHTSIQDGGGVRSFYSVWLTSSNARLVNVEISNSGSSGLLMSHGSEQTLSEFSQNKFSGNRFHGLVLSVPPQTIAKLDNTTDYIGIERPNGTNRIDIQGLSLGRNDQLELPDDLNGVYYFTNRIELNDNGIPDIASKAKLTVNSGTRMEFSYRGSVYVRSGFLSVKGTEEDPVVMTGVLGDDEEVKFFGITAVGTDDVFSQGKSSVVMENVLINHGGLLDSSQSGEVGAIQIGGDAQMSLSDVIISNAVSYGISCGRFSSREFPPENLKLNNVTFSSNGSSEFSPLCGR